MTELGFAKTSLKIEDLKPRTRDLTEEETADMLGGWEWIKKKPSPIKRKPSPDVSNFRWRQTEGPKVTLSDPFSPVKTFVTVPRQLQRSYRFYLMTG